MALSSASITALINALADAKAGNELALAIKNGSKLSAATLARLVIAMGDAAVAADIQAAILGTRPLSARDLQYMSSGFASAKVAAEVASNVAAGVAPGAGHVLPVPIPPPPAPLQVALPSFSPPAGSYGPTQMVSVSSATAGATFYYTTNGSTPTISSTLYSGPISVSASQTLKVLGVKAGFTNSAIASAAYVINGAVATPTFSPVAGTYFGTQMVTLSSATAGASLYYTVDGTPPTIASSLYSGPISVAASETVKVLGVKAGYSNSAIASAAYVINAQLSPVPLLTAANYTILAESGIADAGASSITGSIAVSPIASTAITGFSLVLDGGGQFATSAKVASPGKVYAANYAAPTPAQLTQAVSDKNAAYTNAAGRTSPDFTNLGSGEIGGLTLVPGLYKWTTGVTVSNNVTFNGDADDVWILQISGTLTMASAKSVILSGGAKAENIFWQFSGAATIGTTAVMKGIMLGATAITFQTGASHDGHLYAGTAVNLDSNAVTKQP